MLVDRPLATLLAAGGAKGVEVRRSRRVWRLQLGRTELSEFEPQSRRDRPPAATVGGRSHSAAALGPMGSSCGGAGEIVAAVESVRDESEARLVCIDACVALTSLEKITQQPVRVGGVVDLVATLV